MRLRAFRNYRVTLGAITVAAGVYTFFPAVRRINEMEDIYDPILGDLIAHGPISIGLVRKRWWRSRPIEDIYDIGDVLVMQSAQSVRTLTIGRLVGYEGDLIRDKHTGAIHEVPKGCCWIEDYSREFRNGDQFHGAVPTNFVTGKLVYFVWPRFRFGAIPTYKREHMRSESVTQIVDDLFK